MAAKAAPDAELTGPLAVLKDKFADSIRPGDVEGAVIANDTLVEAATFIRDALGYDYLSSVTGVDYPAANECEVVYHVYSTRHSGPPVVFKAHTCVITPACPRWKRSGPAQISRSAKPGT